MIEERHICGPICQRRYAQQVFGDESSMGGYPLL